MDVDNVSMMIIYEEIVISVVVIAFLIFNLRKKIKQISELKNALIEEKKRNSRIITIDKFLSREALLSRGKLSEQKNKLEKNPSLMRALSLRNNILSIEERNLNSKGLKESNIDAVGRDIVNYFKTIPWASANSEESSSSDRIKASQGLVDRNSKRLDKLLEAQKNTIIELRDKLSKVDDGGEINNISKSLGQTNVSHLKNNLSDARRQYAHLNDRYNELESSSLNEPSVDVEVWNAKTQEEVNRILNDVQGSYNSALSNLENMRQSNNDKRRAIVNIESRLSESQREDVHHIIEKLKLQLRDSEMCTAVLETESEVLREEIKSLKNRKFVLSKENDKKTEWSDKDKRWVGTKYKLICNLSGSSSLESVNKILSEFLVEFNLNVVVCLKSSGRVSWSSNSDMAGESTKKAMRSDASNGWLRVGEGSVLNLKYVSLFVSSNHEFDLDDIASILSVVEKILFRMDEIESLYNQKEGFVVATDKIKSAISSLGMKNKRMSEEGKKALDYYFSDTSMFLENLGLADSSSKLYQEIEGDFKSRMAILIDNRINMDKSIVDLIDLVSQSSESRF